MVFQEFSKNYLNILRYSSFDIFVPSFPVLLANFVWNLNEALLLLLAGKSATALLFKNGSSL